MKLILNYVLFTFILLANGCTTLKYSGIFYRNTADYQNKINEFKYSPLEAKSLVGKHIKDKSTNGKPPHLGFLDWHVLIIGDEYVFPTDKHKTKDVLYGYYVNGNTGKVTRKRSGNNGIWHLDRPFLY